MKPAPCTRALGIALVLACAAGVTFGGDATPEAPKHAPAGPVREPANDTDAAMARAGEAIASIVAIPAKDRTFDNTIGAIDELLARFESETSIFMFMSYVHTSADVRRAAQEAEEKFNNFVVDFGKREDLYRAVKEYADTAPSLDGEQTRLLKFILRDFKRGGMELPAPKRARLAEVEKEIGKLSIEFNKNIAEDETTALLTREELKGVPSEVLERLPQCEGVFTVGMAYPVYTPIMEHAEHEATRQKMWMAYKRRGGKKNIAVLEKVLKLRDEQAKLLGYPHNAAYEIEVRMAKSEQAVREFYKTLQPLVREKARLDFEEFTHAKRSVGGGDAPLRPWDVMYITNALQKSKYAVDGEEVRKYFPMERVVEGLFSITQSLYGLEYKDVTAARGGTTERPLWHEDVKLYEVHDAKSGKLLGEFYLDLYPRENKYSHAAQWGLVQHRIGRDGKVVTPLAALVCNFTKPTPEKPSLLQHGEVETFFHEFGHCLHTIVSESRYFRFSGTSVERDFVEAPSQMFENWVWDADVLATFARHYQTGEALPKSLLDGMVAAKNLGSGLDAENQFYYALTDLAYESSADGVVDTTKVATELYPQVQLFDFRPEGTYYQAAFGHLMHYNAGYYGYMWSKVYACDMFQRFKELGMLNPEAGAYYRAKIISRGGTRDGMDLVRDYLGREPNLDAFADELGLSKKK